MAELKNEWSDIAHRIKQNLLPFMEEEMRGLLMRDIDSVCKYAARKKVDPRCFKDRKRKAMEQKN